MLTENLGMALHVWPQWTQSLGTARQRLAYHPTFSAEQRDSWLESNRDKLTESCRQALTDMSMPKNFARCWIGCFISDYGTGQRIAYEQIRWPIHLVGVLAPEQDPITGHILVREGDGGNPFGPPLPIDSVPPGCWRVEWRPYDIFGGTALSQTRS